MNTFILRRPLHGLSKTNRHFISYRRCGARVPKNYLHTTPSRAIIKPYLLADIGEGITECRVIRWFVKPGDRVNQFDAICEVQSDKASVEITSRYDGVIASIYHEEDEMAEVGKPLLDIDVKDDLLAEQVVAQPAEETSSLNDTSTVTASEAEASVKLRKSVKTYPGLDAKNSGLIVPAVRGMLKQHNIDIQDVIGSGKGGRVLKEDMQRYLASKTSDPKPLLSGSSARSAAMVQDEVLTFTPVESQMFKVMTRALSIPHFGYSHSLDFTSVNSLRRNLNEQGELSGEIHGESVSKLTTLPFIMKALSQAFLRHPRLNAHLDAETDPENPQLVVKASHNFGIAVDTPNGLLVPVVKNVQEQSILSIAAEIKRLSALAKEGRLAPSDMSGATFTVSNIGSIGGSVVNPIIVPPTVGIVALGKVEESPTLSRIDKRGDVSITKRDKAILSWSADHRVLDGATVARCAQLVAKILENIEGFGLGLR